MSRPISISNCKCSESAPEPVRHWREPFDELRLSFQAFQSLLESWLESSSEGSQDGRVLPFPGSDSQAY